MALYNDLGEQVEQREQEGVVAMNLTSEQQQRILAVLGQRTQELLAGSCPLCRQKAWTVADGIVRLNVGPVSSGQLVPVFPAEMPCVALVCDNCGHTELLNLISLGLGDMVGLALEPVAGG